LATGAIRPCLANRISFAEVAEAHRRLEGGGLVGKLVLCPDLAAPERMPVQRQTVTASTPATSPIMP